MSNVTSLSEPLASINELGANPSASGQGLIWNGDSWGFGAVGGGGSSDITAIDSSGLDTLLNSLY